MWISLGVFASFSIILVSSETPDNATFNYFGYGSNLLSNRLKINCPSAKFLYRGFLKGYRLDFALYVDNWAGAVATIVPQADAVVWGAIYTIAMSELSKLDRQEGVDKLWYKRITVPIWYGEDGNQNLTAFTYIETKLLPYESPLPPDRQPSETYLRVIRMGAIEKGLPVSYLDDVLYNFENNGKLATCQKRKSLGYPFYDESVCQNITKGFVN